jgi:hypothetical protein
MAFMGYRCGVIGLAFLSMEVSLYSLLFMKIHLNGGFTKLH